MISYVQNMVKLFQHSRQFYYITTDLQGNYTYVNHYFREQFAHLSEDFIGTSFICFCMLMKTLRNARMLLAFAWLNLESR